jgi:hypothetical protein
MTALPEQQESVMQTKFTVVETANFTQPLDQTDVMTVTAGDLDHALRVLVDEGHALALFNGADENVRAELEAAFWRSFKGPARHGHATMLRFMALLDVLASRRLNTMFLDRGFAMIDHLAVACAKERLNLKWGFNPQRVVMAVLVSERAAADALAARRADDRAARGAAQAA